MRHVCFYTLLHFGMFCSSLSCVYWLFQLFHAIHCTFIAFSQVLEHFSAISLHFKHSAFVRLLFNAVACVLAFFWLFAGDFAVSLISRNLCCFLLGQDEMLLFMFLVFACNILKQYRLI